MLHVSFLSTNKMIKKKEISEFVLEILYFFSKLNQLLICFQSHLPPTFFFSSKSPHIFHFTVY